MRIKKIKKQLVAYLSTTYIDILACLISVVISQLQFEWYYKLLLAIIPWILLFVLLRRLFHKKIKSMGEPTAQCISSLQKYAEVFNNQQREASHQDYVEICDRMRKFLIEQYGDDKISVSLKLLCGTSQSINEQKVMEMGRDSSVFSQERKVQPLVTEPYYIKDNKPFLDILTKYNNSDKTDVLVYVENDINKKIVDNLYYCTRHNVLHLSVPYESVCVIPILPLINNKEDIIGFLCLDAEDNKLFNSKSDLTFFEVISGILDNVIKNSIKHKK